MTDWLNEWMNECVDLVRARTFTFFPAALRCTFMDFLSQFAIYICLLWSWLILYYVCADTPILLIPDLHVSTPCMCKVAGRRLGVPDFHKSYIPTDLLLIEYNWMYSMYSLRKDECSTLSELFWYGQSSTTGCNRVSMVTTHVKRSVKRLAASDKRYQQE